MWIVGNDNKVAGDVTDRDICIALGTRNQAAGDVTVAEVMSGKMYSCAPEDQVQMALETMQAATCAPVAGHHKKRRTGDK